MKAAFFVALIASAFTVTYAAPLAIPQSVAASPEFVKRDMIASIVERDAQMYKKGSNTWFKRDPQMYKKGSNTWFKRDAQMYKKGSNTWF